MFHNLFYINATYIRLVIYLDKQQVCFDGSIYFDIKNEVVHKNYFFIVEEQLTMTIYIYGQNMTYSYS